MAVPAKQKLLSECFEALEKSYHSVSFHESKSKSMKTSNAERKFAELPLNYSTFPSLNSHPK